MRSCLLTLVSIALTVFGFVVWAVAPHSPGLRPETAAALISSSREFQRYGTLLAVSRTTRGADSLNTCCYTATFTVRPLDSSSVVEARADFRFYGKQWHLNFFRWGQPPNATFVHIEPDHPPAN